MTASLHQLTCLTSARFRARAPGPVSGQLCSAPRRRAGPDGAGFLLPFGRRRSLPGHPVPPGIPPLLRSAYRHQVPDHDGVSMFRTREMRLGPGALSTPGTAVPSRPGGIPDRRLPPHSGRSLSPRYYRPSRGVSVTRHQQGFTGIHPSQPSPHLWSPDGTGTLGLFPELRTRLSRTQQRTSGRGRASALPGVTSSASLTSFDGLTHYERPHVALPT
jgi:hypothetical protein